ncbi:DUF934 domain-containing protein [Novosphingopyxis sp.]|uniref:DUF934 domain-containing protein n=1 Tax=Novosphingopyxis sp. TaxID=2709690 RepID=UPI003B58FB48
MSAVQLRYRDDETSAEPAVSVEAFRGQSNATTVLLESGEDARELLPVLDRLRLVIVHFPAFTDGRGYSAARILREAGYEGELRASGDVLVDQIRYMRRCGFDSFAPDAPLDDAAAQRALGFYDHVYQSAADDAVPVWTLRHGEAGAADG